MICEACRGKKEILSLGGITKERQFCRGTGKKNDVNDLIEHRKNKTKRKKKIETEKDNEAVSNC